MPAHKGTQPPGGSRKGKPNKTTASVKAALTAAFEELGGVDALVTWGRSKPGEFYGIWSKLIPAEVKAEVSGPGGNAIDIVVHYVSQNPG